MKKERRSVRRGERVAIHAKLDEILSGGDSAEILFVICLILELRPVSQRKAAKKKGQPEKLPEKTSLPLGCQSSRAQSRMAI